MIIIIIIIIIIIFIIIITSTCCVFHLPRLYDDQHIQSYNNRIERQHIRAFLVLFWVHDQCQKYVYVSKSRRVNFQWFYSNNNYLLVKMFVRYDMER